MMKPYEVVIQAPGMLVNAFGNAETEFAAALVILWHRSEGHLDWVPVSRRTLIDWLTRQVKELGNAQLLELARNPFWRPDPNRLRDEGWITGWKSADDPGVFTEQALRCLATRGLWKTERGRVAGEGREG